MSSREERTSSRYSDYQDRSMPEHAMSSRGVDDRTAGCLGRKGYVREIDETKRGTDIRRQWQVRTSAEVKGCDQSRRREEVERQGPVESQTRLKIFH
jgi:hypothetical protein